MHIFVYNVGGYTAGDVNQFLRAYVTCRTSLSIGLLRGRNAPLRPVTGYGIYLLWGVTMVTDDESPHTCM